MADTVIELPPGTRFIIRSYDPDGTPRGELIFSGDELSVNGLVNDPSKLRLASVQGGAVSMNFLRADGVHEELVLLNGGINQVDPASYGGELQIRTRADYAAGDGAMRLAAFFGSAYGTQGRGPTSRAITPTEDLGSLAEGALPPVADPPIPPVAPPDPPPSSGGDGAVTAVLSTANLASNHPSGDPVQALAVGEPTDGYALVASGAPIEAIVALDATGKSTLRIETHRTSGTGEAPMMDVELSSDGGASWAFTVTDFRPAADWTHKSESVIPSEFQGPIQVRITGDDLGGGIFNIGHVRAI